MIKKASKFILSGAGALIASAVVANFLNFFFNAYLGRVLTLSDFGVVAIMNTFAYFLTIATSALSASTAHEVSYLEGKRFGGGFAFFRNNRSWVILVGIASSLIWILFVPVIASFFKVSGLMIIASFAPAIVFGAVSSFNKGYIGGRLSFGTLALLNIIESFSKLGAAYILVSYGFEGFSMVAIPFSVVISSLASSAVLIFGKDHPSKIAEKTVFPVSFYFASMISSLSVILFLNLDVVLAKHYLDAENAGLYGILALVGKMIYFAGSMLNIFIIPLVARAIGKGEDPKKDFGKIFIGTFIITLLSGFSLIFFGPWLVPLLFGSRAVEILPHITLYSMAIMLFALSTSIVTYEIARKRYVFAIISLFSASVMCGAFVLFHSSIGTLVSVLLVINIFYIFVIALAYPLHDILLRIARNIRDILYIFNKLPDGPDPSFGRKRILMFNWRDTKHNFAGGAEIYVHELAKRFVRDGHAVTLFCGSDRIQSDRETVDGVRVIRHGGFYGVYPIAAFYYIFRFRGKFDAIIDCENGIPFFSPLYAKEPVYLLIHHVHQEVFRKYLVWPLAVFASFLERCVMPIVYRNCTFITISESSKKEIYELGIAKHEIEIVHPGIDTGALSPGEKSPTPLVSYVGRLKEYKSVDVLIKAFVTVSAKVPDAKLIIAGDGEDKGRLESLTHKLKLENKISFLGKVSDEEKCNIMRRSWVFVNPSMMEGWGITTIEANACGTPVVAADVSGLRDSVQHGDTGFLTSYGDEGALAEKIIYCLQNERVRDEMAVKALLWANKFNWDKSAHRFGDIITGNMRDTPAGKPTPVEKRLSVTVGIPTCYGGVSLIPTIESIRSSRGAIIDRIIVIADRMPISDGIRKRLAELGVEVVWNEVSSGVPKKIAQFLSLCTTDILVLTKDAIIFEPGTLLAIIRGFENHPDATIVSTVIRTLPAEGFFEKVMTLPVAIAATVGTIWNGGDNYLSASGRCFSFRTGFMRKVSIPEDMVNCDTFQYLKNKELGGKIYRATDSVAYIRAPQNLKDHLGPSNRYQISHNQMTAHFNYDLSREYQIPLFVLIRSVVPAALRHPVRAVCYFCVLAYTRLNKQEMKVAKNPLWTADISTKQVKPLEEVSIR